MKKCLLIMLVLCLICPLVSALALGSGGILNWVEQARVYKNDVEQKEWRVYVHPFEGSLVIVPSEGSVCYALDKAKWITFTFKKESLVATKSVNTIDVPENIAIVKQKVYPAFSRDWAETTLDNSIVIRIVVDR